MHTPLTSWVSRPSKPARSRSRFDAPSLVAEALLEVREPLITALRPGPFASPAEIAAALARSLAPLEASDQAPVWLWPEQIPSFRRALRAVRAYGGALLADPVGTGKTYVGLAVASVLNGRRSTACLVPATLVPQWEAVARRLAIPVVTWSHERVSRGSLPARIEGRLVLIDESHHFRNDGTKRYGYLAPWLVGRQALLITASPVVNRLADLQHQLALTIRDDALAPHGVPCLAGMLEQGRGDTALSHVIIARPAESARRPARREQVVALDDDALLPLSGILAGVNRLKLSNQRPIAALVRGAFWRAAASSPAALVASLDRYYRLLQHAADAAQAGQALDRRLLQAVTNQLDDQLLLWELLPLESNDSELALDDIPLLDRLRAAARAAAGAPDPKLTRLGALLADRRCSIVFAAARETVRYLRDRIEDGPIAWCTGERAGIGPYRASRQTVLDWFRPAAVAGSDLPAGLLPRHLIATDVAAEGLDLHRAERVIHYDLPWTPARIDQREGRAWRAGAVHRHMEAVRFEPPPAIETRLRQLACLTSKRRLPSTLGLDQANRSLWRWRVDVAERFRGVPSTCGIAELHGPPAGILAGFALYPWDEIAEPVATWVLWWDRGIGWTEAPDVVERSLAVAASATAPESAAARGGRGALIEAAIARLAAPIRERMQLLRRSRWIDHRLSVSARRVIRRLQTLSRAAARRRNGAMLGQLQAALQFTGGGHTAGEQVFVAELATMTARDFERALGRIPAASATLDALECRLTGLIVFSP